MKNKDPLGIEIRASTSIFQTSASEAVAKAQHKKENAGEIDRMAKYTVAVVEVKKRRIAELENEVRMLKHHLNAVQLELRGQKLLTDFFEHKVREKLGLVQEGKISVVTRVKRKLGRKRGTLRSKPGGD